VARWQNKNESFTERDERGGERPTTRVMRRNEPEKGTATKRLETPTDCNPTLSKPSSFPPFGQKKKRRFSGNFLQQSWASVGS